MDQSSLLLLLLMTGGTTSGTETAAAGGNGIGIQRGFGHSRHEGQFGQASYGEPIIDDVLGITGIMQKWHVSSGGRGGIVARGYDNIRGRFVPRCRRR